MAWYNTMLRKEGIPLELFLTGLCACLGGALISWVNFLLLRRLMNARGDTGIAMASPVRMLLSAAYFVLLYFTGKRTDLSLGALLIGGALGLTVTLCLLTLRLSRGSGGKGKE